MRVKNDVPAGAIEARDGSTQYASAMPTVAPVCRQQQRLGQRLLHQARAAGPEGRADGQFLLPRDAAREQEIRHVDAGDEKQEADRAEQQHRRAAGVLHDVAQQRIDEHPATPVDARVGAGNTACDAAHLQLRLLARDALRQACEHGQVVSGAVRIAIDRHEHVGFGPVARLEVEVARQYTEDRVRLAVQHERPARDRAVFTETPRAQPVGDERHARAVRAAERSGL